MGTVGWSVFLGDQPRPRPKVAEPQRSSVWGYGVLYLSLQPLIYRTTKCGVVTHIGRSVLLGQPRAPSQMGLAPALPNCGVLPCLCVHDLQRPNSAWTYRIRTYFRSQPRHCILRKGVARFVSDSRVSCKVIERRLQNHSFDQSINQSIKKCGGLSGTGNRHCKDR